MKRANFKRAKLLRQKGALARLEAALTCSIVIYNPSLFL